MSLTWAYLTALGVIALMTIVSHIMTAHITARQKESVEVAYKINRQRAIIQDVIIHARTYYELGDKLDLDFLTQSLAEMQAGHLFLTFTINQRDLRSRPASPALTRIFFEPPFMVDKNFRQFTEATQFYISIPPTDATPLRRTVLNDISSKLSTELVRGLDVALETYQSEVMAKTSDYARMQLYSALLVLLVLALEGVFIFRPLVRRMERYHHMLRRYALEDHLTGLNNRRAFMKRASSELQRAARAKETVIVVLSDLDKFKSINDTYGHKTGDTVLRHFAAHVQKILRTEDLIGRIGGEEFAILLPRTNAEMGYQTIDRLREMIAQTPCEYVDDAGLVQSLSYTASFGLVVAEGKYANIDDLLALADTGLYQAKHQGRNRVIRVDSDQAVPVALQTPPPMPETALQAL